MTQIETHELRLQRTYEAPIDKVWAAVTTPEMVAKWFAPGPMKAAVQSFDLRVNGQYEVAMTGPSPHGEEGTFTCAGVFTHVDPHTLKMTFNWSQEPLPNDTDLTIELESVGNATQLTMVHTGFANQESATHHTEGWTGCMEKLASIL